MSEKERERERERESRHAQQSISMRKFHKLRKFDTHTLSHIYTRHTIKPNQQTDTHTTIAPHHSEAGLASRRLGVGMDDSVCGERVGTSTIVDLLSNLHLVFTSPKLK